MNDFIEELKKTDPEFADIFSNFALDEVVNQNNLDDKSRYMAILATLIGCQGLEVYKELLLSALESDVTAIEVKEIVYQAAAYLGFGRVYPFINITNEVFMKKEITLPLELQGTTTKETRREKGTEAQVKIFGDGMKEFWKGGHINKWLAANCFGDYYTRKGLDLKQREMITFCFISAQGGCESQLIAHATGNMMIGNDKTFLINVVSQCLPYIGYPRSLNAISCINEAEKNINK